MSFVTRTMAMRHLIALLIFFCGALGSRFFGIEWPTTSLVGTITSWIWLYYAHRCRWLTREGIMDSFGAASELRHHD